MFLVDLTYTHVYTFAQKRFYNVRVQNTTILKNFFLKNTKVQTSSSASDSTCDKWLQFLTCNSFVKCKLFCAGQKTGDQSVSGSGLTSCGHTVVNMLRLYSLLSYSINCCKISSCNHALNDVEEKANKTMVASVQWTLWHRN